MSLHTTASVTTEVFTAASVYMGGVDFSLNSLEEIPDYVRLSPPGNSSGSVDVTLPPASFMCRITIRNMGSAYSASINPNSPDTLEGGTGTYSLPAGSRITVQGIDYGMGVYGWEIVGV